MERKSRKKLVLLGTGGTIAGRADSAADGVGYTAAQLGVQQLLSGLPMAQGLEVEAEQVAQIDSKDMGFAVWQQLAERVRFHLARAEVDGVLITHGTDTLEETAYFLHRLLAPAKPVVLTCAMRPATALMPDGPQNLLDALALALDARARGVLAVCAGTVHGAVEVQKMHTYRLDAFGSGDAGPLAYVEEGAVRWLREPSAAVPWLAPQAAVPAQWPRVEIVLNHAGAGGGVVDALLAQHLAPMRQEAPLAGLVVAGTGNGTLHAGLQAALLRAQAAGVRVVRSSRCPWGRVLPTAQDVFPDAEGLSAVKARVALMLALAV